MGDNQEFKDGFSLDQLISSINHNNGFITLYDDAINVRPDLLRVSEEEGSLFGYFNTGNQDYKQKIGFVFSNPKLDHPNTNYSFYEGHFKSGDKQQGVLYIPVKTTNNLLTLGGEIKDDFYPDEGSPFKVLGLKNSKNRPLELIGSSKGEFNMKGLYLTPDNSLKFYDDEEALFEEKTLKDHFKMGKLEVSFGLRGDKRADIKIDWKQPKTIVSFLDQYVVGQENAKKTVAVSFSNYMTRLYYGLDIDMDQLPKDNLLLIGSSGVGKTYMLKLLGKEAGIPFIKANVSGKSSEGLVGQNLSSIFLPLYEATESDNPKAIFFLDEFCKLVPTNGDDMGLKLQSSLIGWVEDGSVAINDSDAFGGGVELDLSNVLFVGAGAFANTNGKSSLVDLIKKRQNKSNLIGFGEDSSQIIKEGSLDDLESEDLIQYGILPELIGRFPVITTLNPLSVDNKLQILNKSKGSILEKYSRLLKLKGYDLNMSEGAKKLIVERSPAKTGARGMNGLFSKIFTEILFDPEQYVSKGKITINKHMANKLTQ